jgi:hypothetical protein
MLVARLKAQHAAGSRYYVGDTLSAVDVDSVTFTAMFGRAMRYGSQHAGRARDPGCADECGARSDPVRSSEHLELPLSL